MFAGVKGFFKSVSAVATDAYFNLVTLLLPGNGTNGAQNNTFLDSSTNNFTITRNGNTTQGTFSPFSQTGWSNYFDGTGDYLSRSGNAAFDFGTGDFTVEGWFYLTSTGDVYRALFTIVFSGGQLTARFGNNTAYNSLFQVSVTGASASVVYSVNKSQSQLANGWHHFAFTRSGTTCRVFIDGTQENVGSGTNVTSFPNASFTDSTNITTSSAVEVGRGNSADTAFIGYISNVRVLKGTAQYTSSFTPPTAPLTAITNTSFLTCQSNRFIDNSSNAFAITVNGDTSVQAFSPFAPTAAYSAATNGGSGYFDGTGDYLTGPTNNAAFDITASDFCVEMWYYRTSSGATQSLFSYRFSSGPTDNGWEWRLNTNNTMQLFYAGGSSITTTATVPVNTWTHLAVTRSGTTVRAFINGALDSSATFSSSSVGAATFRVGVNNANAEPVIGYISGARLVNGSAVYTAAFTPPTAPLTAITNTQLLLNFTNAGITDATAKNVLETVGNAQISTTQSKFGGSSMYFDGTGDWLFARYNQDLELGSGDFTIECWVYFSTLPSNAAAAIASYGDTDGTPRWIFYYDSRTGSANGLRFTVVNGSGTSIVLVEGGGTSGWAANTWYHVAITRSGSSWRLFRDGTQTGSTLTDTDAIPAASNNGLYIGSENGSIPLTGYIDDFRITKGYARYTANFSAPTAAFPVQ